MGCPCGGSDSAGQVRRRRRSSSRRYYHLALAHCSNSLCPPVCTFAQRAGVVHVDAAQQPALPLNILPAPPRTSSLALRRQVSFMLTLHNNMPCLSPPNPPDLFPRFAPAGLLHAYAAQQRPVCGQGAAGALPHVAGGHRQAGTMFYSPGSTARAHRTPDHEGQDDHPMALMAWPLSRELLTINASFFLLGCKAES